MATEQLPGGTTLLEQTLRQIFGWLDVHRTTRSPEPFVPSDDEILKSALLSIDEARRQIDHQSDDAGSIDTKASALLTLSASALAIAITRLHLDNPERIATGALLLLVGISLVGCCIQALRPRKGFSYGADPGALVSLVQAYYHTGIAVRVAESLADARIKNVTFLNSKQDWYARSLSFALAGIVAAVLMVQQGAIS